MFGKEQYIVFMDYETTGIDTSSGTKVRPIQIGCIYTDRWLNKLFSYKTLIKWPEFMMWKDWPKETKGAYKVHGIPLKDVVTKGLYAHEVAFDLINVDKSIRKNIKKGSYKPVIISDAPNFEMFWTEMIYGSRDNSYFPFHYNAWSVNPMFKLLDIKMDKKPHDALDDATILWEGMKKVYEKLNIKEKNDDK